jgi:hypothetical protein
MSTLVSAVAGGMLGARSKQARTSARRLYKQNAYSFVALAILPQIANEPFSNLTPLHRTQREVSLFLT